MHLVCSPKQIKPRVVCGGTREKQESVETFMSKVNPRNNPVESDPRLDHTKSKSVPERRRRVIDRTVDPE